MNPKTALTTLALLVASLAQAQSDAVSTYFSKYVDDPDFTVVYISGKMFNLMESVISTVDTDELNAEQVAALSEVVRGMQGLRILTTDKNGIALYEDAKRKMTGAKPYELLMTVREKNKSKVDFYTHESAGKVDELLLLVGQANSNFVLLSFVGNIDVAKINDLARAFDDDDDDDDAKPKNKM